MFSKSYTLYSGFEKGVEGMSVKTIYTVNGFDQQTF